MFIYAYIYICCWDIYNSKTHRPCERGVGAQGVLVSLVPQNMDLQNMDLLNMDLLKVSWWDELKHKKIRIIFVKLLFTFILSLQQEDPWVDNDSYHLVDLRSKFTFHLIKDSNLWAFSSKRNPNVAATEMILISPLLETTELVQVEVMKM